MFPSYSPSLPVDVAEVAEHRGAGVVRVLLLELELAGQERVAARRVDEEAAGHVALVALLVHRVRDGVAALREFDAASPHAFDHVGALRGAVAEQQVIELRAPDLVGVRLARVEREAEVELVVPADLHPRVEIRAGLLDADRVDLIEHAEAARRSAGSTGAAIRRCGIADGGLFRAP